MIKISLHPITVYDIDVIHKYFILDVRDTAHTNARFSQSITSGDIQIAITGKLVFYVVITGKPNMDFKWCPLCQIGCC